jgi:hypothetical protein
VSPATIADAQMAARVKTALVNDAEIGEFTIEVHVRQGVATLSGWVRSQAQAARAVDLAQAVAGVSSVRANLRVGGTPPSQPAPAAGVSAFDAGEIDVGPGLLAVGGSVGWSIPRPDALKTRISISPVIKLGSPLGLAPVIGFDWFQADVESVGGGATLTRVHVRPVMGGLGYTMVRGRLAVTPSLVGGYAFNSLTVIDTGIAQGLPVEVGNSLVWRAGASAWYDLTRRVAINASMGYVMTGFRLTVLEDGRLGTRDVSGDTLILHVGAAYRLF